MFCFKCGASLPDTSPTCPQCGATMSEAPQVAPRVSPPAPPATPYSSFGTAQQSYSVQQQTDGKATASMILGILSLICFGFGVLMGIPAVILGHLAKSSIRKGGGRLTGDGMATAGLIMGYISVALLPLMIVAIILPNRLMRTKTLTNEAAAQSAIRTINTAQASYSISYPSVGYARDLSTLGPAPSGPCSGEGTQEHACLIDATLGCSRSWCIKDGYRYQVSATCGEDGKCTDYLIVAVPVSPGNTGRKSFCSGSDAVLRVKTGISSWRPPTASECQSWPPE